MGDTKLRGILSSFRMVIIAAGVLLSVMITSRSGGDETYTEGLAVYGGLLDQLFYIIYAVGILCALSALLFGIYFFGLNVEEKKGTMIGAIGFAVIGIISFYIMADSTVLNAYEISGITVSDGESWFAGGGLYFVYLLGAASIVSIVAAEVMRLVK